ncbi:MAG: hypothetical protein HOC71_09450 [Candidatus Latescibacteria bacterium]|nr:hypothetical protein [Candidatus Latescibacterota bacterium]
MSRSRYLFYFAITVCLLTACGIRPFFRPPGEKIGSCKGYLKPEGRLKMHFSINLYKEPVGDFTAYMSIPSRGIRYGKMENIDIEDSFVRVELSSPRRVYEGTLIKEGLIFEGSFEPWIGKFRIELEE